MSKRHVAVTAFLAVLTAAASAAESPARKTAPPAPTFAADGTVHVPPFDLPPSELMSDEAKALLKQRAAMGNPSPSSRDIDEARQQIEQKLAPLVGAMRQRYQVDVEKQEIAGVPVRIVTPQGKAADPERVLINLHGGAFTVCAEACALLESVPISSLGGYRVVSVDYQMAPEHKHPAGVEDVATVYRELLKNHKPQHIGIYGCSAGGALTAQTAAWLPAHDLPQAGAIGIFGAGAVRFGSGDSAHVAGYIDGSFPPPPPAGQPAIDMTRGYFDGADVAGPIVSPALHLDTLAQFPPTLLITGTRAMDMSPAIFTNSQLLKAGVDSTLVVGEGLGHCYIYMAHVPEARDAYQLTVDFFRKHLR